MLDVVQKKKQHYEKNCILEDYGLISFHGYFAGKILTKRETSVVAVFVIFGFYFCLSSFVVENLRITQTFSSRLFNNI